MFVEVVKIVTTLQSYFSRIGRLLIIPEEVFQRWGFGAGCKIGLLGKYGFLDDAV